MPYTNQWETEGLYRKFTGEVSGDEILESNFELHEDPKFRTIKYIINDFSALTGHSIKPAHTQAYATTDDIISITKGRLKIALVVTREPFISLANNYTELMDGKLFECKVFDTIESARKWADS